MWQQSLSFYTELEGKIRADRALHFEGDTKCISGSQALRLPPKAASLKGSRILRLEVV